MFLDEINTCQHMGIITEAICHRSLNGRRLSDQIKILAALNPYRMKDVGDASAASEDVGLQARDKHSQAPADAMKNLVYKVHPIPSTLKDFIFDFGSLNGDTESKYIESMVTKLLKVDSDETERAIVADLISRSQKKLREVERDASVVSLRDVYRCVNLINWFCDMLPSVKKGGNDGSNSGGLKPLSTLCRATVLSLGHVYCYRLPTTIARNSFWLMIGSITKAWGKQAVKASFERLGSEGIAASIVEKAQRQFVNNLYIEPGIALNKALTENLYVTIICILNKIPIFIVGKPGNSDLFLSFFM